MTPAIIDRAGEDAALAVIAAWSEGLAGQSESVASYIRDAVLHLSQEGESLDPSLLTLHDLEETEGALGEMADDERLIGIQHTLEHLHAYIVAVLEERSGESAKQLVNSRLVAAYSYLENAGFTVAITEAELDDDAAVGHLAASTRHKVI